MANAAEAATVLGYSPVMSTFDEWAMGSNPSSIMLMFASDSLAIFH
jgi:hypothetical protein